MNALISDHNRPPIIVTVRLVIRRLQQADHALADTFFSQMSVAVET